MSRTADLPGQTLNVDLCFVPVSHLVDVKLPAVSGSSGHLVVERLKEPGNELDYPGKVFADPELDYAEAVQAFVKASRPLFGPRIEATTVEKPSQRAEIQQLRQEEAQLCTERRNIRKRLGASNAAKNRLRQKLGNPNCVPAGGLAKYKKSIGKSCANNIVNSRSSANRKTNCGA